MTLKETKYCAKHINTNKWVVIIGQWVVGRYDNHMEIALNLTDNFTPDIFFSSDIAITKALKTSEWLDKGFVNKPSIEEFKIIEIEVTYIAKE